MKNLPAGVCVIEAPCKINLHLKVGEKRPDGFHDIESLFVSLSLADTLRFECSGNPGECRLETDWEMPHGEVSGVPLSDKNNLVMKAVSLFRERTGMESALNIRLCKRIPPGAGLGGGSSDAASSLLALNYLAGSPLSEEELGEMAAVLGSDVSFFLSGGAAFVSGRGELVKPVKTLENLWVVLVKPAFSSDTSGAFRLLDELRASFGSEMRFSPNNAEGLIKALAKEPETWPFYNDFLPVFPDAIQSLLDLLKEKGASFASLSGSGSCCFGVFKAKKAAEEAVLDFTRSGTFAKLTFFLAHRAIPVVE